MIWEWNLSWLVATHRHLFLKSAPEVPLEEENGAGSKIRTRDLWFTKPLHYHCAIPAFRHFLAFR